MKRYWHKVCRDYNKALLESCIDEQMSKKLQQKVEYHEIRGA